MSLTMQEIQKVQGICKKYLGKHHDELLRPSINERPHGKREDYDLENPHHFSSIFYCLLCYINKDDARLFREYYQRAVVPLCLSINWIGVESEDGDSYLPEIAVHYEPHYRGVFSRQPFGKNFYDKDHREYKPNRPWNTISKEEITGLFCLADDDTKEKMLTWLMNHHNTYDDWTLKTNFRYWQPPQNMYVYKKACGEKPNWLESGAFYFSDFMSGKVLSDSDSIIKNFVRGHMIGKTIVSWEELHRAFENYFNYKHPFKSLLIDAAIAAKGVRV